MKKQVFYIGIAAAMALSLLAYGCSNASDSGGVKEPAPSEKPSDTEKPGTTPPDSPVDEGEPEPTPVVKPDDEKPGKDPVIDDPNQNPGNEGGDKPTTVPLTPLTPAIPNSITYGFGNTDIYPSDFNGESDGVAKNVILNGIESNGQISMSRYFTLADKIRPYLAEGKKVMLKLPESLDEFSNIKFVSSVAESEVAEVLKIVTDKITEKDENGNVVAVHTDKLPTMSICISPDEGKSNNLYEKLGGPIDQLMDLYYNNGAVGKYTSSLDSFVFDAKAKLNGGYLYNEDNSVSDSAYVLDINKALLMNIPLKNVKVGGSINEDLKNRVNVLHPLTNVYFDKTVDLSTITTISESYGVVEFAGMPPQKTPVADKVIIRKTNSYNVKISDVNVLELRSGVETSRIVSPSGGLSQNIAVGEVYYDGSTVSVIGLDPDGVYYRTKEGEGDWQVYSEEAGYTRNGDNNRYWEEKGEERENASQPLS